MSRQSVAAGEIERSVSELCGRFEEAWRKGARPDIATFLPADGTLRSALLPELVLRDMEQRARSHEPVRADEYLARFPELSDVAETAQRLREAESRLAERESKGADQSTIADPREGMPAAKAEAAADWPSVPGYEILAVLGTGGMGVVYRARQIGLNRLVALKMIRDAALAGPQDRLRFRKEAEAVARLVHPNVVQIHDIGECGGLPYFALEYCALGSLAAYLQGAPLEPRRAAQLIQTLALAVDAAHQAGIIHRDLKPGNVLLQPAGPGAEHAPANFMPKIADFGLAKTLGDADASGQTASGQVVGTPSYMAPEQARGVTKEGGIGPAADVYALGAILYELLTGRPPFRAASVWETVHQVIHDEPVAPIRLNPATPRDLDTICLKCLHKEPARRYDSAAALADDLERLLEGKPIRARRVGPVERTIKWTRRNKAMAAFLAALAVLVIGGVAAGFWFQEDRRARRDEDHVRVQKSQEAIEAALDRADAPRCQLHATLAKPGGVFELLNDPARWQGHLQNAAAALATAKNLLAGAKKGAYPDLDERAARLESNLRADEADRLLAEDLERIRIERSAIVDGQFDFETANNDYAAAFARVDPGILTDPATQVAARLAQARIKEHLVAALDDWAYVAVMAAKTELLERLLEIARLTAPDPAFGDRLRRVDNWSNPQALAKTLQGAKDAPLTAVQLALIGVMLTRNDPDAGAAWMRQAQARYPGDFWLNYLLGNMFSKTDPVEAAGFLRAAIAVRPNSAAAYHGLGVALVEQKKTAEAIAAYRKAVKLDSKLAGAYRNLANVLRSEKRYAEAVDAYRKSLDADPRSAAGYTGLGNVFRDQKKLADAMRAYEKAIELDPNFAYAHNGLGNSFLDQGQLAQAARAYRKAITADARFGAAYNGLGHVLRLQGKLPEAHAAYAKAIELEPKSAAAHDGLGAVLRDQKSPADAVQAFRKAIELDATSFSAYNNLGNALNDQKLFAEAMAAFEKAIALNPKSAVPYNNLGHSLRDQKKLPAAAAALRQALDLDPGYSLAHRNLGLVLRDQQNPAEALAEFEKAIACDPKNEHAHYDLGNLLRNQGRHAEAATAYQKAIAIDPNMIFAHYNLGMSLSALGKTTESIAAYRRAIALKPDYAQAHCNLGHTLKEAGEFVDALQAMRLGHEIGSRQSGWPYRSDKWVAECEELVEMEKRLDRFLAESKPAPAADLLKWAVMCRQYQKRYATAADLYLQAFKADPKLVDDLPKDRRFDAACAAAWAGTLGDARKSLGKDEKAAFRRRALDWLKAELDACAALAKPGSVAAVLQAQERLKSWQDGADLAGVRDAKSLADLPAAEQADWRAFWAGVDRLARQLDAGIAPTVLMGVLTAKERERAHPLTMQAGTTYVIDMKSSALDSFLQLHDSAGVLLKENDDASAGTLDARIVFTPKTTGVYRITATSFQGQGRGAYTLTIRVIGSVK